MYIYIYNLIPRDLRMYMEIKHTIFKTTKTMFFIFKFNTFSDTFYFSKTYKLFFTKVLKNRFK